MKALIERKLLEDILNTLQIVGDEKGYNILYEALAAATGAGEGHQFESMTNYKYQNLQYTSDPLEMIPRQITQDERSKFEAWSPCVFPSTDMYGDSYEDDRQEWAFIGWKARAALDKVKA